MKIIGLNNFLCSTSPTASEIRKLKNNKNEHIHKTEAQQSKSLENEN